MKTIDGGVTAAKGFAATSCAAGIKYKDRTDTILYYGRKKDLEDIKLIEMKLSNLTNSNFRIDNGVQNSIFKSTEKW